MYYVEPDWFNRNVLEPAIHFLTRLGVSVWGSRILRVKGRKSGEWRSHPVNLLTFDGHRYIVSPRGQTQWVRNIRVSGGGELELGGRRQAFRTAEIGDQDKIPILREYMRRWKFEVGVFFRGVSADSPESELNRIAPDHPVFRVDPADVYSVRS